jgi:hypothetical protein
VGTAVSIAKKNGIPPHGVYLEHLEELQQLLMEDDCFLPHFERRISDSCRKALICNGTDLLRSGQDRASRIYGTETHSVRIPNGQTVEYRLEKDTSVHSVHLVFDSDLNRDTLPGDFCERGHVTRANVLLNSPQMHLPKTLCKAFRLTAVVNGQEQELLSVDCNIKRAYHLAVQAPITALRLTMTENWSGSAETELVSFDFN